MQIVGVVAGALIDSVFWLIDRVFDAIEAIMDLVSWTFEQIGNWLSPKDKTGTVTFLPPTPQVIGLVEELEKQGKVKQGIAVKIKAGKAAVQTLVSDNEVKRVVIAGSDKGFSTDIQKELKVGNMYKIPVEE